MGMKEVFIDPCPGCEDVGPGIVTPGGPPSPPLTRRWGGIQKKVIFVLNYVSTQRQVYLLYRYEEADQSRVTHLDLAIACENQTANIFIFNKIGLATVGAALAKAQYPTSTLFIFLLTFADVF